MRGGWHSQACQCSNLTTQELSGYDTFNGYYLILVDVSDTLSNYDKYQIPEPHDKYTL